MNKLWFIIILLFGLGCGGARKELLTEGNKKAQSGEIGSLRNKVTQSPADTEARIDLSEALIASGDYDAAIEQLDSALVYQPGLIRAKYLRADAYYLNGDRHRALSEFQEVLQQEQSEDYVAPIAARLGSPYPIRQLTQSAHDNIRARYSYSGNEIVYQSNRDGNWEIYRMPVDGSTQVRLTHDTADDESPEFSPDGRYLLFTSTRNENGSEARKQARDIFIMNASDGTGTACLVANPADDWNPVFSPDGQSFIFASDRADERDGEFGDRQSDLFIYYLEDSLIQRFTHGFGDKSAPCVSSDNESVIYVNNVNGDFEIYEQSRYEKYGRRLVWGNGPKGNPRYSNDGKQIVYFEKSNGNFDLYLYDRKHRRSDRLTRDFGMDMFPCFSRQQKKLLFSSNRSGSFQIYEMDLSTPVSRNQLVERIANLLLKMEAEIN